MLQKLQDAVKGFLEIFWEIDRMMKANEHGGLVFGFLVILFAFVPASIIWLKWLDTAGSFIAGFCGALGFCCLATVASSIRKNGWWLVLSVAASIWITSILFVPLGIPIPALFVLIVFLSAGAMFFSGMLSQGLQVTKEEKKTE